ncbi:MAG: caspase family protein [Thermodesulfovibrionales bacterium]|nr:caspase family protein [Thermodesulfovibrionales bacterium]
MCKTKTLLSILFILLLIFVVQTSGDSRQSPVDDNHVFQVNRLFRENGIYDGFVAIDRFGRLELKGAYNDEQEVDKAFSLAQTVVGIKWVSPVTPENIKVKEWERRIGRLFERAKVLKPSAREDVPPGPVKNKYALIVGIGKFKHGKTAANPRGIEPLQFTVRDAISFNQFLVNPNLGGFKQENIIFLTDHNATRDNIANAFEKIKALATEDDLVVVYLSSHGTPPDKYGGVFIVAYDTEVIPRERVWHTAVSEAMLRDFIEGLQAKRLVMILDTCYSNGAYRSVPGFLPPGGKSLGAADDEGYGISTDYGKRLLGSKDIVIEDVPATYQKSQGKALETDGWGKVLISASGAGEQSWESDKLNQSIFTYYFLDGLKRHNGSVKNAFYYAKPLVAQRVKQEKGKDIEQNPQVMATNRQWDMRLMPKK